MDNNKSLDVVKLISALLCDVSNTHGGVFDSRACSLTCKQVEKRVRLEGIGFLTKTLPRLGKALDKALSEDTPLNAAKLNFSVKRGTQLPRFLGELFQRVLHPDGTVLQNPCVPSIRALRLILYLFYKYELPYAPKQEQEVLAKFEETEQELQSVTSTVRYYSRSTGNRDYSRNSSYKATDQETLIRKAQMLLWKLFSLFDPTDIIPKHGPGAVSTRQSLWNKFNWENVSGRITRQYPLDAYFFASQGAVCDRLDRINSLTDKDLPARVCLVPKDSRGPRLISCEPVDYQWIQQGLLKALIALVEGHELTKFNVFFTNQQPNQFGALIGSKYGRYSTLDLKEASDRVTVELVHLLFPEHICDYLMACRSSGTVLPDGREIKLLKFAPMGSALCFPVMALTIWSLLSAGAPDAYTRKRILVYGDDVVVPTAYAENAIIILESLGLKVNRDKSCIKGFFRESCGVDAFKGENVTPIRIRKVWSSSPSPGPYASWISYANSFWDRKYYATYDYIAGLLFSVYGKIPAKDSQLDCPSLAEVPDQWRPKRSRINLSLQKREWLVRDVQSRTINHSMDGWSMLLRYFSESEKPKGLIIPFEREGSIKLLYKEFPGLFDRECRKPFRVRQYTKRDTSMLVFRWR